MEALKYKVIKSRKQYDEYCEVLDSLIFSDPVSNEDEIDLLTALIEKFDRENNSFSAADPITVLKSLMADHNLKAKDLVQMLGVSKGLVSDILNRKKGLSKDVIRKLADHFKMNQEAFNRSYTLSTGQATLAKVHMKKRKKLTPTASRAKRAKSNQKISLQLSK